MLKNPLYIAEKPKMGSEIAKNLPGPHVRGEGFIKTGAGVVTWAIGHLLEQVAPEGYDPKYKGWNYGDLPIIPGDWKVAICNGKSKQMQTIKSLLKECSDVVNAGDPGREGQLIVDEILEFFGNRKPVWRLILNSLDGATVKKALDNLLPNSQFIPLYQAALGRQRADWLIGMNMTRAYTLLGQKHGYGSVLSVGRVQTPTLAIVVRRELEIEQFVPKNYWQLKVRVGTSPAFVATYDSLLGENDERPAWLDESLRIIDSGVAARIKNETLGAGQLDVISCDTVAAVEPPPLPFELADIQSRMNASCGASVQDVLEACQSLYESGYASYPRTDCAYLPTSQLPEAPGVLASIARARPDLAGLCNAADVRLTSRAWNDAKLGEHHAIIPTGKSPDVGSLSPLEQKVFDAICRRYIAQFHPDCQVDKTAILLKAGDHHWRARGRVIRADGWRVVYNGEDPDAGSDENEGGDEVVEESSDGLLPDISAGQKVPVAGVDEIGKTTKPPSRYSEGTLMQVMKHVDRLVSDPNEKKVLKNVKGIGQPATRAAIISTLIKRQYFDVRKKQLHPTDTARMLVKAVDPALIDPGLTARWEHALDAVAAGRMDLSAFQQKQEGWVRSLIKAAESSSMPPPPAGMAKPASSPRSASGGKPVVKKAGKGEKACPKCGSAMRERTVKNGPKTGQKFMGCSGYPNCNHSEWPK